MVWYDRVVRKYHTFSLPGAGGMAVPDSFVCLSVVCLGTLFRYDFFAEDFKGVWKCSYLRIVFQQLTRYGCIYYATTFLMSFIIA